MIDSEHYHLLSEVVSSVKKLTSEVEWISFFLIIIIIQNCGNCFDLKNFQRSIESRIGEVKK